MNIEDACDNFRKTGSRKHKVRFGGAGVLVQAAREEDFFIQLK
jgi:hypothetical protein